MVERRATINVNADTARQALRDIGVGLDLIEQRLTQLPNIEFNFDDTQIDTVLDKLDLVNANSDIIGSVELARAGIDEAANDLQQIKADSVIDGTLGMESNADVVLGDVQALDAQSDIDGSLAFDSEGIAEAAADVEKLNADADIDGQLTFDSEGIDEARAEVADLETKANVDGLLDFKTEGIESARAEVAALDDAADIDGTLALRTTGVAEARRDLSDIEARSDIEGRLSVESPDTSTILRDLDQIESASELTGRLTIDSPDTSDIERDLRTIDAASQISGRVQINAEDILDARNEVRRLDNQLDAGFTGKVTLDDAALQDALQLIQRLNNFSARVDVTADPEGLQQALRLAEQIDAFDALVDVGANFPELRDAFDLTQAIDNINAMVRIQAADESLRNANDLAEQLERPRTVPVDADASGVADSVEDAFRDVDLSSAGAAIASQLSGLASAAGPVGLAATAIGLTVGDELIEGINSGFNRRRTALATAITSGLSGPALREAGEAGGAAYLAGFGESAADVTDIAADIESVLGSIDPELDLSNITRQAQILEEQFGVSIPQQVEFTGRAIRLGLVEDTQQAFDVIFATAQRLPGTFEEALDNLNEFGSVYENLGFTSAEATDLIAATWETGLLTNMSRASEIYEEFTIRLRDGTANEAISEIGLSAAEMQDALARQDGQVALDRITVALLGIEDQALRDRLAVEIFGAALESTGDPTRVLEANLNRSSDAAGELAGKGEEIQAAFEEVNDDSLARVERAAVRVGQAIGTVLVGTLVEALDYLEEVGAAAELVSDTFDSLFLFAFDDRLGGGLSALTDKVLEFITGVEQADGAAKGFASSAREELAGGAAVAEESLDELEGGFNSTEQAAKDLQVALDGFSAFTADRLFRDVLDATEELGEAFGTVDESVVGLGGAISITDEGGADLQETFEGLSDVLIDAAGALAEGEISAAEFSQAQADLEQSIRAAGVAAGLSEPEIQGLVEKYVEFADAPDVQKQIDVITDEANGNIDFINAKLEDLPPAVQSEINAIDNATSVVDFIGAGYAALPEEERTGLFGDDFSTAVSARVQAAYDSLSEEERTALIADDNASDTTASIQGGYNALPDSVTSDLNASDNASSIIQKVKERLSALDGTSATTTIFTRNLATQRLQGFDGLLIDGGGARMMHDGGFVEGLVSPKPGGVPLIANGAPVVVAENGGQELFLNEFSSIDRQLALIRQAFGGRLYDNLREHFSADSAAGVPAVVASGSGDGVVVHQTNQFSWQDRGDTRSGKRLSAREAAAAIRRATSDLGINETGRRR